MWHVTQPVQYDATEPALLIEISVPPSLGRSGDTLANGHQDRYAASISGPMDARILSKPSTSTASADFSAGSLGRFLSGDRRYRGRP